MEGKFVQWERLLQYGPGKFIIGLETHTFPIIITHVLPIIITPTDLVVIIG